MQQVSTAQETMALFDTKHYINIIFKVLNFHLAMFFFSNGTVYGLYKH